MLQIRVRTRHDPAEHVAGAGDGVHLQQFRHRGQMRPHVPAPALPDLQRRERGHRVPQRLRIHLRAESAHHPVRLQPVQPGLHGAASHAEAAGGLHHPDPRLLGEQPDQAGVQLVHGHAGELLGDRRHCVQLVGHIPENAGRHV